MSNTITNKFTGKDYLKAKGVIPYGMTNDYIFRIVFQENKYALKGLLCSILGLKDEEISSLEITNEVKPGTIITDKEYRMDIVVNLNDDTALNLEMQVKNYNNWQYRSLCYLCREFDNLDHGDDFSKVRRAYQIGFLDFTPFEDHPEFYGIYQMRNAIDGHLYTDRFNLIVISLNQIDLATNEDKARKIDTWARLFKSKTWEELKMIANDNDYMNSAVETLYLSNKDYNTVKIARERDDFLRHQVWRENEIKKLREENAEQARIIAELEAKLEAKNTQSDANMTN
jgi:predicted transposase/invertase (TIGR01784 family)